MGDHSARIVDSYPLSAMQLGMLYHHLSPERSGVDLEQIVCGLREDLDLEVFRSAWSRLAARHPVLRTSFRWEGAEIEEPIQQVYREAPPAWQVNDWTGVPEAERRSRFEDFLRSDREQGFRLDQTPLQRVTVLRYGPRHYQVIWTFPHILFDGRSFPILLTELFDDYEALCRGEELAIPAPPPYRDYIEWLGRQALPSAEAFWRRRLAGFDHATPLPGARTRPIAPADGVLQGEREIELRRATTDVLRSFAGHHDLSLNTIVQGAWALILGRYGGTRDVVFGATRAGRYGTVEDARAMVGVFINTLPVRVRIDPDAPLVTWLRQLRARELEVRELEHTPLVNVQSWSDVAPGTPLFESLLVFDSYLLDSHLKAQGGTWLRRDFQLNERTNFPLTLYGYGEPALLLKLAYDRDTFADAMVERVLANLAAVLEGVAEHGDRSLRELPLLSTAARRQILSQWNETATDFARDRCVHELFEARAGEDGDKVALRFAGERVTYRQLDERAGRLARYLRRLGVGPDVLVGICVERSIERPAVPTCRWIRYIPPSAWR